MNVLYCGDKNIQDGLIISILSLLKQVKESLNIYVLTIHLKDENQNIQEVPEQCIEMLDRKVKEKNHLSFVKKINITEKFQKEIPRLNMATRFTPCCMLRLFADEIQELPDRLLYLDNDVICRKDCTEFYHQDIEPYEFVRGFRLLW